MIAEAFALGLSTGAFCMGFCAPVLMGLLFSRQNRWTDNLKSIGLFLAGRLFAYLLFGVITFMMGKILNSHQVFANLLPIGEILLGLLMLIYSVNMNFPHWSVCQKTLKCSEGKGAVFAAGIFTGMNLCPPFILAVSTAIRTGSLANSLVFFFIFFLATSLYLLPFVFSGLVSCSENIRSAARIVCGLAGGFYLVGGLWKNFV
ncbi:MAG: sulfite exporter TauE/SafE family protein [Desulfobacterales bacterium]|nr:sulfite exporter TauE/SafE family protein [Desulfobacterales bacterium]